MEDYLKPKVFLAGPSTRVTAPSEKNVVAYNSIRLRHFLGLFVPPKGRRRRVARAPLAAAAATFDGSISLWLKYIVAADGRSSDGPLGEKDDAHLLAELR
jgi:hypothetical protein